MNERATAEPEGPGAPLEREIELRELDRVLTAARAGEGALAMIEGPAGIGKTTLLGQLRARADSAGVAVLAARGSELEREFAFGVVRQLFEAKVARLPDSERDEVLDGAAAMAAPVLGGPGGSATEIPGQLPEGTLHGLYWLLVNLAEREPLVLVIDDAHWADAPSVEFLEYLTRRLEGVPVLAVLAARTDEPDTHTERLRALAAESPVLRPSVLSPQAVRSLARRALGTEAPNEVCDACHSSSGGNPFLLGELLGELRDRIDHRHELAAEDVPAVEARGVAALLAGRLAKIGGAAPQICTALAVLGDGTDLRHLAALAEVPIETAGQATDALADATILSAARPPAFLHPLLRAAAYAQLAPSERARLHDRAARLLADSDAPPEIVSSHLLRTEPNADDWIVGTLREAASTSLARGAPQVAVPYLKRALGEPPPADARGAVLRELGTAEVLSGDPAGVEHLRLALVDASPGRPLADVARVLAQGLIPLGRLDEAADVLYSATAQLPDEERELALELEAEAGSAGRMARATHAQTAERMRPFDGELPGDTRAERLLLANLAAQELIEGTARSATDLARRAGERGLLDDGTTAATFYDALVPAVIADSFELARRYCDAGLADARRRGSLRDVSLNLMFRSHLSYREGRVADAEADASAALDLALEGGFIFATTAAAFLVDALIERGELAAGADAVARAWGDEEIPDTWMTNWLLYGRGKLRIASGEIEDGLGDLELLGRREYGYLGSNPSVYPYRSAMAIVLAQRGERDRAHDLATQELELARAWGTPRSVGIALRSLGLAEGDRDGLERIRAAVSILEPSGARLEHARALVDLGAALRRRGTRVEAREQLAAGMDRAHRCGATVLAEQAREELVTAGARPRRLALSGVESLTASERRIAAMAADGLKNKEIAQALFVTVRTVEMHLGNTYRKLDISSREQLPPELGKAVSDA